MSIKETFSAGVPREFFGKGDFFRLLETTSEITVEFFNNGRETAEAVGVQAGYAEYFKEGREFDRVKITSALTQDVKFVIRYGSDVRYDRGAANVTGTIEIGAASLAALETVSLDAATLAALETVSLDAATLAALETIGLDAATLAALESVDLNTATLNTLKNPLQHSGAWVDASTLAVNTPVTVFTPASNTNGVILLDAHFNDLTSAMSSMCFISKASAPANAQDGRVILPIDGGQSGVDLVFGSLKMQKYIPAGQGLYFISSTVTSAGRGHRSADWKNL